MDDVKRRTVRIDLSDRYLGRLSRRRLLSLSLGEMREVRRYFLKEGRAPSEMELETVAQAWSEHCRHKTFRGNIDYIRISPSGRVKKKKIKDLLKSTIIRATLDLDRPWCLSVFSDNAGIIEFDRSTAVVFKVETHNHPTAIEPYGGSATGIGGVMRDVLGAGLGAYPVLNTDVFCFGPLNHPYERLPAGIIHPKRIFRGVVSGVRDYGNRMGVPTLNGAIFFDEGYLFNPLVYCGTAGILSKKHIKKTVSSGDLIVLIGGRTGRDGIHGATFSSRGLDRNSPASAVQIADPVTERKFATALMEAKEKGLYSAVTDCGAGGLSSAIGEMGSSGSLVYLDRVPLKTRPLRPWEIWISESQERMVLAVPGDKMQELMDIFDMNDVETTVIGEFNRTGRLKVFYGDVLHADLDLDFLHNGLPVRELKALWYDRPAQKGGIALDIGLSVQDALKKILASPSVCSKEDVIRQYDHEVQGTSVLKPLCGLNEGPSDASVIKPVHSSIKGIAVSNGINPYYGRLDPYWMAASCVEEALRNIVSVGGDLGRTALLDNFCWGDPEDPILLGGLVRAAQACHDMSKAFGTPFISGKDSLNNEYISRKGKKIPVTPTLLVSALSVVKDIRKTVTMDIKGPAGNRIYIIGETRRELGGSQLYHLKGINSGRVPEVRAPVSLRLMRSLQKVIERGLVSSCHDCSEGGLAVAISEMAFSGAFGLKVLIEKVPVDSRLSLNEILFSESNSRFLVEVPPRSSGRFETLMRGVCISCIGRVIKEPFLEVIGIGDRIPFRIPLIELRDYWRNGLRW